jgi:methyl-accepting chemotaxis protein
LLRRWRELSEIERRAFAALIRELSVSSDLVETSTQNLSERFQALAAIAEAQVGRMDNIVHAASALEVRGETMTLDSALSSVEITLCRAVENVLFVSKHAMRMVYTLEDVARDVAAAEQCTGQIESINRQARYLALNAAIEATRSGAAGAAFSVIAHEMKDLAQATEKTSVQVRDRIASVTEGVRRGHEVMREIATMDLSENIMAKERIDLVLEGLKMQNDVFSRVLEDTSRSSIEMAGTVNQLIAGIQFQDRTKQHIAQVIDTITALSDSTETIKQATDASFPGLFDAAHMDQDALARIVAKQTLGDMKTRVLNRLLGADSGTGDADAKADGGAPAGGDIELF